MFCSVVLRLAVVAVVTLSPLPLWGQTADYVIQISVDGLHAGRLRSLLNDQPQTFPNFRRFIDEGATTYDARNDNFSPYTLPNHITMITGRPVLAPADDLTVHHGFMSNMTPLVTQMLHSSNPNVDYIASVFDVAHDHGRSTALYATKQKFSIFEQTYNQTEHTLGGRDDQFLDDGDDGSDKIDQYVVVAPSTTSSEVVTQFVQAMGDEPFNLSFVHLLEPDFVGHSQGWQTPEWDEAIALVDQHLGRIFELVDTDDRLRDHTTVLLTTDHGGLNFTHDRPIGENVYRIPFFAWGVGVAQGANLYELNRYTRNHPGNREVDYLETPQPIRNGDLANLALDRLGLPPVDGSSLNHAQDLLLDLPRESTWVGEDPQSGEPGDAIRWTDPRNWVRADQADVGIVVGDALILPVNFRQQTITLSTEVARVKSMTVAGQYRLDGPMIVHTGRIDIEPDATLTVGDNLRSPEGLVIDGGGELIVSGSVDDVLLLSGFLSVYGSADGSVAYGGTLSPSHEDVGTLNVAEDLTQTGTGTLTIDIVGGEPRSDEIHVQDATTIRSGRLSIRVDKSYSDPAQPGTFDRFPFLTTRQLRGTFGTVDYDHDEIFLASAATRRISHAGEGLFRIITYDRGVSWINYRAIPGDVDGDGQFATTDLVALFTSGGFEDEVEDNATWVTGDWDGDLDFTTSDLVAAFAFGGYEQPSVFENLMAPAAPEPNSAAIVLSGFFVLSLWRRRR